MRKFAALVLFAAVLAVGRADEEVAEEVAQDAGEAEQADIVRPHVMVLKLWDGSPVSVGRSWTLTYTVVNVGQGAAHDVEIQDSFAEEVFDITEGSATIAVGKLAAGAKAEFNVTVVPKVAGEYKTQRGAVSYKFEDEEQEDGMAEVSSFTSDIGTVTVLTPGEYERQAGSFVREWTTFFALASGPMFAPLFFYNVAKNNAAKPKTA